MNTQKISVIICSIEAGKFARISESYKHLLAGHPLEIIGIHDAKSLAEGYNRGIQQSSGDILIFSHDDILIIDPDFHEKIVSRLATYDVLGFVGTSRLITGTWFGAGQPYLHGVISHARPKEAKLTIDIFGVADWPIISDIKAVDGLCMITKREVAVDIGFDATTFDGFHLYDLDFSFSAYRAGYKLAVCCDIPIIHESTGQFDSKHQEFANRFISKHGDFLDAGTPADNRRGQQKTPAGRGALLPDYHALLRTWHPEVLKRTTAAIHREALTAR